MSEERLDVAAARELAESEGARVPSKYVRDLQRNLLAALDALDERNNSWHRLWVNTTALWHRLLAAEKASEKSMARVKELEAERSYWVVVKCPTCNGIRKPCDTCWGWRWIYRHKSWDETRVLREGQDG